MEEDRDNNEGIPNSSKQFKNTPEIIAITHTQEKDIKPVILVVILVTVHEIYLIFL
jgi:hypothetical protein